MIDETAGGYPAGMRAVALLGLLALAGLAFILLDIVSDGKLAGCDGCGQAAAGA